MVFYIAGIFVGIFVGGSHTNSASYENIPIMSRFDGLSQQNLFIEIAINNLRVGLLNFLFSLISFGLISCVYFLYNGFVFGITIGCTFKNINCLNLCKLTLPHSILEFAGFLIMGFAGFTISKVYLYKRQLSYIKIIKLICLGFIIINLAAYLEAYVSTL